MIGFQRPELLLLALPALYAWWRWRDRGRVTGALRLAAALSLVAALAAPYARLGSGGRDLVVVVDRSRSMPPGSQAEATDLLRLIEAERGAGDRVGVVSFGRRAAIERLPSAELSFSGFQRELDRDASDLGAALETALGLIPAAGSGGILVLSDGENNGTDPVPVARRAFSRGVRIDVRPSQRAGLADLSVERIDLPQEVNLGEPFQFTVWVRSDRRVEAEFTLDRGSTRLSSGRRLFEPGLNRLVFHDALGRVGVSEYEVRLSGQEDRVSENDRGVGALRVLGPRTLLVVNHDGAEDSLVRALRLAGLPVVVRAPEGLALDRISLTAYRGVILENVAASRLGAGLSRLREFVTERGGGLLVTGGRASFGVGGYFLSAVDEILPVSMEMRQEHRELGVALAIVMDRSGSMSVPVSGGQSKMDLANLGAAAAIELLSPLDSVGVIAVDSAPHLIQALTPVEDPAALARVVRRVRSEGGGIYVFSGLRAAGQMLRAAPQQNRHVILFADAADSEEQEGVPALLEDFEELNISVSVIALGSEQDPDAGFLIETARDGAGEVYFTTDPVDLPRLFAQDTLTAARSTFIELPTQAVVLPDLFGMGELLSSGFPAVGGYNLTYLREGAVAGVVSADQFRAPLFAFAYEGLGRTAAYTGEVGGEFGAGLVDWPGFPGFFVTAARWLLGQEEPTELFPTVRREGSQAVISVEVDPDAPVPADTSFLIARLDEPGGVRSELVLERVDEQRFEARHSLSAEGTTLGIVQLDEERFVELPPIALPYSPEFERSPDPDRGERLLSRLARESGGQVAGTVGALFDGPRGGRAWRVISRELLLAGLLLLLLEIAGRRLQLWSGVRLPRGLRRLTRGLRAALARRPRTAPAKGMGPVEAPGEEPPEDRAAELEAPQVAGPEVTPDLGDALERARKSADRRLGR